MMMTKRVKDMTGERFGRLTVVEYVGSNKNRSALWKCVCDCGTEKNVTRNALRCNKTKSCGCLQREASSRNIKKANAEGKNIPKNGKPPNYKHGETKTKLHKTWQKMRRRCRDKNWDHYERYGGRGIKVCEEWNDSYIAFRNWALKSGYDDSLELDRIDNDGDYCPENCRWATRIEQMRNRTITIYYEINGVKKPLKDWCEELEIDYKLAHARYIKGYSTEEIFDKTGVLVRERINRTRKKKEYSRKDITVDLVNTMLNEGYSIGAIAKELGCNYSTIITRVRDLKSEAREII